MRVSKKRHSRFFEKDARGFVPRLPTAGGQFDTRPVRSVFRHVHAEAKNESKTFRGCGRENRKRSPLFERSPFYLLLHFDGDVVGAVLLKFS